MLAVVRIGASKDMELKTKTLQNVVSALAKDWQNLEGGAVVRGDFGAAIEELRLSQRENQYPVFKGAIVSQLTTGISIVSAMDLCEEALEAGDLKKVIFAGLALRSAVALEKLHASSSHD